MKQKIFSAFLLLALAISCTVTAFAYTVPGTTRVYVTPTGECYHRKDCSYIKNSFEESTVAAAEADGYRACSRCKPDVLTGQYESNWDGSSGGGGGSGTSLPEGVVVVNPTESEDKSFPWWTLYLLIPVYWVANWWRKEGRYWKSQRAEYAKLYEGKPAEELAGMPLWLEIGDDGLPKEKGKNDWGNTFTVYMTKNGHCFHMRRNCCRATNKTHIVRARKNGRRACSKCVRSLPDLEWYDKYKEIRRIKKKYRIG